MSRNQYFVIYDDKDLEMSYSQTIKCNGEFGDIVFGDDNVIICGENIPLKWVEQISENIIVDDMVCGEHVGSENVIYNKMIGVNMKWEKKLTLK